jgi:hypothetical protein
VTFFPDLPVRKGPVARVPAGLFSDDGSKPIPHNYKRLPLLPARLLFISNAFFRDVSPPRRPRVRWVVA